MTDLNITALPAYKDNYIFHFMTPDGLSVVVDPGDASPVTECLRESNLGLDIILLTHHHWDHTNGVGELKETYGCEVWGPAMETERIPDMDVLLEDEKLYDLGDLVFKVFYTPGHTKGHICLYFERPKVLFCGDTLFSLGCGRVFEGTMEQMYSSLQKLKSLPNETKIFCAHEYTLANAEFALSLQPDNKNLESEKDRIEQKRANGRITIPSELKFEKTYNPFLTAKNINEFTKRRQAKDQF